MSWTLDPDYESTLTGAEVAIVGMAGRFPGAVDVDTFWRNLLAGGAEEARAEPAAEARQDKLAAGKGRLGQLRRRTRDTER